jgi:hypothetical protein
VFFDDPQTMYVNRALTQDYLEQIGRERYRPGPIREYAISETKRLHRAIFWVVFGLVAVVALTTIF